MSAPNPVIGLRALADPVRLAVARLLTEGAFNVGELQDVFDLGQSTISHHLKILLDAGLLVCRREGRLAYYQWEPCLPAHLEALRGFVQQYAPALDVPARQRLHRVFDVRAERTRAYFSQPTAEAMASERSSVTGVDVTEPLVSLVPSGATVVDLGTGAGRLLEPLRQRAAKVIGIDASPSMLERAGRLARERHWGDIDLRLGTLEHLPLRDGEVDAAVAHLVFHHAARPEVALAEAQRALKPGGVLAVGDFLPHDQEWMREELADQWLGFEPEAFVRMLVEAGFEDVQISRHPGREGALGMFVALARRPAMPTKAPAKASQKKRGTQKPAARGVKQ